MTETEKLNTYKIEYFKVDRKKIISLLDKAEKRKHRTEKHLSKKMGITYASYWRRFKLSHWRHEHVVALAREVGKISGIRTEVEDILV